MRNLRLVLGIFLAIALIMGADQGMRAAANLASADAVAAVRAAGAGPATTATGATAKDATPAATPAPAPAQAPGQAKKQSATGCTVNGKLIDPCPPGIRKQAARQAARQAAGKQVTGVAVQFAGVNGATAALSPLAQVGTGPTQVATMATVIGPVDYFGIGNWANSPLPTVTAGVVTGGIKKFVDPLGTIPLAVADTASFPGSDFYKIGLKEYTHAFAPGSALPAANVRGYYDKIANAAPSYLGPLILATRNRPTRVMFTNELTTDLPIPTDTTYMGAGLVKDGVNSVMASQRRATLHLHGGNTPWISDGTTHQWTTPVGGDLQPLVPGFAKGFSAMNVPDMVDSASLTPCKGSAVLPCAPSLDDGMLTFFWTNQQSGRLMFYHDHAFGMTRLDVYAGEAAGYLLVDPAQESALLTATAPGTIVTDPATGAILSNDLGHMVPLVIQDKTFVPDPLTQLAAQDPTWDVVGWGGLGSLWFPHVYSPNQNPADLTGANGFGRYDWGPWFWPPQNAAGLVLPAYACTSIAVPAAGWAFPPLMCPGVPDPTRPAPSNSPSSTPEAFMDTPIVNGVAYPTLTVAPAAYRFQVLNAANDRTLNLGLYIADPLTISVVAGGSGYAPPPAVAPVVTISGCTGIASASANVDLSGAVIGINVVLTNPAVPPVCTPGGVTVSIPAGTTPAYAIASVNTDVHMVPAISAANGRALPNCGVAPALTLWGGGQVTTTLTTATGLPSDPITGLPNCWPEYSSPQGYTAGTFGEAGILSWGNSDGRVGGVPDPLTAGPPIIQIGAEGGLLPQVAVIPSTPVSYDYNKRSITVLNVLNHGLLLGPAERADIIVDFSNPAFAGKTLILYNDAPAPVPAGDPRLDYFTNDPDFSTSGGAPTTMAGYGPNTRTIMQINVTGAANPNVPTFALATLQAAVPPLFAATQDAVIVPEAVYPAGNGAGPNTYLPIQATSVTAWTGGGVGSVTLTSGGAGYTSVPTVSFTGGGGANAAATAVLGPAIVASVNPVNAGFGYTVAPAVTITGGGGASAAATAVLGNGGVRRITVVTGGSGYSGSPQVLIGAPPIGGVQATATATIGGPGRITAINVTNPGAGYLVAPSVTILPAVGGTGSGATATALLGQRVVSYTVTNPGSGYTSAPTVAVAAPTAGNCLPASVCSTATASATLGPRVVASVTLTNGGSGYTSAPTVAFVGGAPTTSATAVAGPPTSQLLPKAIQELFTLDYGRMNATLGVEVPFTNFLTQTTIPYGYADPPTEIFKDGETQFWKITHNGVDTHFMHFHLFTVQVINRIGWDGAIKPPDPNEVGFKDTVRMNPLEDIVVALRPFRQTVPFAVPNSTRPMLVTEPVGYQSTVDFTNIDPANNPATVTNAKINFGWEYVWHCHILGHEENDMMRAMILAVVPTVPTAGAPTSPSRGTVTFPITASASPTTPVPTGFSVQRATSLAGPWTPVGSVAGTLNAAGTTLTATFTDTTAVSRTTYYYQVVSNNVVGYTAVYAAPAIGYPHVSADSAAVTVGPIVSR